MGNAIAPGHERRPGLVSVVAAADRIGISPYTVRTWTRLGRIPHIRLGRRILFDPSDLERFIQVNRVEARGGQ